MTIADVLKNSLRGARYELDIMAKTSVIWRPYVDSTPNVMLITDQERAVMIAPCPLIYMGTVKWCYTDRVTKKFGFLDSILNVSLHKDHSSFHESSSSTAIPLYCIPACVDQYSSWYSIYIFYSITSITVTI